MKNAKEFRTMNDEQMMEINGGGFAYDVGRFIRYLALGGGIASFVDYAYNDAVNYAVNQAEND